MSRLKVAAVAYALIGVVAFGHSASGDGHKCARHVEEVVCAAVDGLLAGFAWPLYVSWVAAEALRTQEGET